MKSVKALFALLFVCGVMVADQAPAQTKCGCQKPRPTQTPATTKPRQ